MESCFQRWKLLSFLNPEGILFSMHPDAPLRRITTWLAILGYLLVASGLPLPLGGVSSTATDGAAAKRIAAKDRSRPFPCMDKACGCATANQCFTSCCCNTPAETLAWARAHHVEPAVLLALEHRVSGTTHDPLIVVNAATDPSCCAASATKAETFCCATASPTAEIGSTLTIGSNEASVTVLPTAPADDASTDRSEDQPRDRSVTLRAMLACGGIVAEWFAAGATLPPPRVELTCVMSVLDICTPADEAGECLRPSPAAPPPRAA